MIARHDLAHSKTWRGLLGPALDTTRRLVTVQAVLAVQRPAQPDLHPLPVRDHEDVPLYPYPPAWEMPLYPYPPAWEMPLSPYPPAWEMPLPCADAGFPIRTLPINAPDAVITTSFLDAHQGARFLKGR